MLSEEIRSRLSQLNRLAAAPSTAGSQAAGDRQSRFAAAWPAASDAGQLQATEIHQPSGRHWLIRRPVEQVWPEASDYLRRWQTASGPADSQGPSKADLEVRAFCLGFPRQTLFLDLETCGFAGSMVFLVGLLHPTEQGLMLSQLFARNYAEERPMLQSLEQHIKTCRILVTFNGKSFDWPQVRDRCTLHRIGTDPCALTTHDAVPWVHYDLLHHARRRWRHQLPNCKLQTLERYICRRHRTGDIPGHDIPRAYHDYVRRGDLREIRSILHHNALDLITLLQLSWRIALDPGAGPSPQPSNDKISPHLQPGVDSAGGETKKGRYPAPQ
jgi:hypothetical protein